MAFDPTPNQILYLDGHRYSVAEHPHAPGMAGMMVGAHRGVLIAAGGANFPDVHPWDGGKKKIYSEVYVLLPGQTAWTAAGHLPGIRGYGATVSLPEGVLIAGGEDVGPIVRRRSSVV